MAPDTCAAVFHYRGPYLGARPSSSPSGWFKVKVLRVGHRPVILGHAAFDSRLRLRLLLLRKQSFKFWLAYKLEHVFVRVVLLA